MRIDHQKVQLVFLRDGGVSAVKSLYETGEVSKHTVKRALKEMRRVDPNDGGLDALENWMKDAGILAERNRRVRPGDVRRYKVQDVENGAPFLRMPLDTFDANKGDEVEVHFFNGSARVFDVSVEDD